MTVGGPALAGGQRIGYLEHAQGRVAYATLGSGPPLLCDVGRIHHLERFWRHPPYRRLLEALGRHLTVICFDRPGCGLSDRSRPDFTLRGELALFDRLLHHLGLDQVAVLASGSSAPVMIGIAALRPERVSRLVVAAGSGVGHLPQAEQFYSLLLGLLQTDVDLAVRLVAEGSAAGSDGATFDWLAAAYRETASADVISQWVGESIRLNVLPLLPGVRCPTLVLHRRDDRTVSVSRAREIAAGIPGALLLPLDGASHLLWDGDTDLVLDAVLGFLAPGWAAPGPDAGGLSPREVEVARLVELGLTNREIAERLGIMRRTVEGHVDRIRDKLGLASRAEVAAWSRRHIHGGGRSG